MGFSAGVMLYVSFTEIRDGRQSLGEKVSGAPADESCRLFFGPLESSRLLGAFVPTFA